VERLRVAKKPGKRERDNERAEDRQDPSASGLKGPRERGGSPALVGAIALDRLGNLARLEFAGALLCGGTCPAGLRVTALRHQARAAGGEHR
ncbi:MAG: hypothetical protein JXP72_07900, partial [Coriobacteriia bacterium]|nr:hypothetical protein [Coriobacteriia bacterium]